MTGDAPLPVLLLDSSPMFSGAQRMALRVLLALRAQGRIDLTAWVRGETASRLRAEGAQTWDDPLPFFMPGYDPPHRAWWLARRQKALLARRSAGRVVYANGVHSGLPVAVMGQRTTPGAGGAQGGVRVHVRDILRPRWPTRLTYGWLRRSGFDLAGVSGPVAANITALGGGPAGVLYDPAPVLQPVRPQAHEVCHVGFVGNLIHFKGPDLLLRALGLLPQEVKNRLTVTVVGPQMAGHEDFARSLPQLAAQCGVNAEFLGRRDDAAQLMRTFDLLVLPSTWPDPFPGVVLEGVAADTPVVATAVGGVPEMLPPPPPGLNPWLCPHDPQALASVLALAIASSGAERRQRLDDARRHLQANFGEAAILEKTFRFLAQGNGGLDRRATEPVL